MAADNCTWGPVEAGGIQIQLSAARVSQLFSEAPKREAIPRTPANLAADFVKQRPRKLKNVAFTAWQLTEGEGASPGSPGSPGSPVYLVGALVGAEAGTGAGASMRLRLLQTDAQAQASRPPPTGAAGSLPARHCSVFLDKAKRHKKKKKQPQVFGPVGIRGPLCVGECDGPIDTNPLFRQPTTGGGMWNFFMHGG